MASTEFRGPAQMLRAAKYSWQGIRAAWRFEASFRLEVMALVLAVPGAYLLGRSAVEKALLLACYLLVPAMELMNAGLEAIVDKTTPEMHELAGRAKDMGSAAVFFCMMIAALMWLSVALDRFVLSP
jgi:diacylglycerol kinase (ATP)